MCRDPKLWIILGVAAIAVAVVAPSLSALLPFVVMLACPLSMVVMMRGMSRHEGRGDDEEVARLRAEVANLRERAAR